MANQKISALTTIPVVDRAASLCEICNAEFRNYPSWNRRTCSRVCGGKLKSIEQRGENHPFYGKQHSLETRKKISTNRKGKNRWFGANNPAFGRTPWNKGSNTPTNTGRTHFTKGQTPWNRGIAHLAVTGENNYNWRGGVTPLNEKIRKSIEYRQWRNSVFVRDNYTCQVCDKRGGWLEADHIKQFAYYPELRFDISNGQTLCKPCHKNTKTWGNQFRDKRGRFTVLGANHV